MVFYGDISSCFVKNIHRYVRIAEVTFSAMFATDRELGVRREAAANFLKGKAALAQRCDNAAAAFNR